jgi:tetratricopeptide (TPR) repeat protein
LWQAYLDDNKENLKTLIQKARDKFEQNEYFYSIDLFSICIKKDGTLFYSWQFRGDCYWKLNDYKNALNDYLKSIELDPTNGAAYDDAAMCFFNIGDYDKAHSYIDKAIQIEGENDMPMVRKAQFFEFQQKKTEALNQYKRTLEKFPKSEYAQKKILELTK